MRLIDADVLKESMKKVTIVIDEDVLKCETINDELLYLLERVEAEMKKKVDECLTAFNVEEVVDELEKILDGLSDGGDDWFTAEKINEAIDIVRKGGVK